jgi:NitT/TauT family transport system ATP-binding protein
VSGVALEAVAKRFDRLAVVEPLSLTIDAGSFVSIVGPSGCGKSTLLRMVAGLEPVSAGTITVDGLDPVVARRGKRIAVVPQQPGLLPWRTVRANASLLCQLGATTRPGDDVDALLHEVGLADFVDALPHELSGGMQQRVALVRALALGAPLVLMDEPFAALDEITRADMRGIVNRLVEGRGVTVLLVTHSITEAVALSDRVLVSSPRPARVVGDVTVGLPRPRAADIEDDPAFVACCADVRHLLHRGSAPDEAVQ